jgi:DNA-binding NtrC family response regulator
LEANGWNKAAAARQLGISWDHLRSRIKKYRLTRPGSAPAEEDETGL